MCSALAHTFCHACHDQYALTLRRTPTTHAHGTTAQAYAPTHGLSGEGNTRAVKAHLLGTHLNSDRTQSALACTCKIAQHCCACIRRHARFSVLLHLPCPQQNQSEGNFKAKKPKTSGCRLHDSVGAATLPAPLPLCRKLLAFISSSCCTRTHAHMAWNKHSSTDQVNSRRGQRRR